MREFVLIEITQQLETLYGTDPFERNSIYDVYDLYCLQFELKNAPSPDGSRQESVRWNTPVYDHIPFLIFSYTRTLSGGRKPNSYGIYSR